LYLGIDLGTSGLKAVLVDAEQRVLGQAQAPLDVSRPRPLWSEQDPEDWWRATEQALVMLARNHPTELAAVRGIGLSGQMHGATLLDAADRVLRPAILWNDGRSAEDCAELERLEPEVRRITGNLVMPGFTAPKLLWAARAEPEVFARVTRCLLPKDYLRLRLTGDHATDLSDASGTLWLDVAQRAWSEPLLAATGLPRSAMPSLFEGSEPTGTLRSELARAWGMAEGVVVAAGGGDQAAGAVGAGCVEPGSALLSLGTSGVLFVAGDRFAPNPDRAVHAFCHALPQRWHQMSVILSAASCLAWVTRCTGGADAAEILAECEAARREPGDLIFLPYLSGERTPHNDPTAAGVFFGLRHEHGRADLVRAVLEGVAFAMADGQDALLDAGAVLDTVTVIGGGARSELWVRILAAALGRELRVARDPEVGPAFGAARLARLAVDAEAPEKVCRQAPAARVVAPDPALAERYEAKRQRFRDLYETLRPSFADAVTTPG